MNFYEQALALEKEAHVFYKNLKEKCATNEGIKNILDMLARDHGEHEELFDQLRKSSCSEQPEGETYRKVVDIFNQLKNKKAQFSCDIDQVRLYNQGLELIRKKLDFYQEGMNHIDCDKDRGILKKIIEDEQKQVFVIEDIIEMVSRPDTWVEDAEFYHFEEY